MRQDLKDVAPWWGVILVFVGLATALAWVLRDAGARTCSLPAYPCVARPSPQAFPWSVVGELALVVYAYARLVRMRRCNDVFLGLAFWAGELIWEMANGVMGHFCGAPWFGLEGVTAWRLYSGVNIEISLMFAMVPPILVAMMPRKRKLIAGKLSNRTARSLGLGVLCVGVEVLLNRAGALTWAWWYWRSPHLALVLFAYCSPFVLFSWVQYHVRELVHCVALFGVIAVAAIACHLVCQDWIRIYCP